MKRARKKLNIEKLVVAKISNMKTIRAGIIINYSVIEECDLTTRPRESVEGNNCESQNNCDMSFE